MEVRAIAKYVRVQPRKVRIIADEVRGKAALHTVALLRYHPSKSAKALRKVLLSAIANAAENHNLTAESLDIATITVDEGPRLKRMQARAMGRGNRIVKKTSHITVVVADVVREKAVKPHGTKPKPRPTFGAPAKKGKGAAAPKAAAPAPVEEVVEEVVETPVEVVAEVAAPVAEVEAPVEAAAEAPAETEAEPQAEGAADNEEEAK